MSRTTIKIRVVRSRLGTPLMVLDGGPFNGVELSPHQMRYLAAGLAGVADAIAEEPVTARSWRPRTIVMGDALGDKAPGGMA